MKAALLLCLLVGCKAHFEEEGRTHATVAETVDAAQQSDTHIVDAPDRTTTTVEEFAPPQEEVVPTEPVANESGRAATRGAVAELGHGPLVKRTVTVTEHGAVTIDQHTAAKSQAREDSELDDAHKAKESFDFLSNPLTWIGAGVLVAAVIGVALKLRKAVPV